MHVNLEIKATKFTTRDGLHQDDTLYLEQIKSALAAVLADLDFRKADIKLEFAD